MTIKRHNCECVFRVVELLYIANQRQCACPGCVRVRATLIPIRSSHEPLRETNTPVS